MKWEKVFQTLRNKKNTNIETSSLISTTLENG